jgi:DnaK suppressor protein
MSIDLDRFRTDLLEERVRVERAIANLRDDHPGSIDDEVAEISGTSDNHLTETAAAALNREVDHTLEENSGQVLAEIDAALKKIDDGTYGTCAGCGGQIAEARLDAHQWASLCIDCARKAERW